MSNHPFRGLRAPAVGASAAAALALLAGSMLAGPAGASVENISVAGLTSDKPCSVADGCVIQAALGGTDQLSPVDFLVNGAVIGTLTPTSYGSGAAANLPWHPANDGTYTVGVRQGFSNSSIVYVVGKGGACPPVSSLFPGSSSSGSAGSGSASGSAGSGSASGSGGSGSAGTGSAGSGSASGSDQPLPVC
ncbi:hypothetical protein [Nocardia aurantiaca]|uniref:Uncharacterized protein n=1 Tax=Nocardia aurantiaca TaxID=2675850 RepID=A0A6I3KYX9_9NOCA|nr:hypothetical protein [Nocardia aurantiaca]MTE13645.1 hypothetical protein [Nocardia aurantiaca]